MKDQSFFKEWNHAKGGGAVISWSAAKTLLRKVPATINLNFFVNES
jgi:hypothetical protein